MTATPLLLSPDLSHRLGDLPPGRIRFLPPPGRATEADVLAAHAATGALCELVDGTLVEKPMAYRESMVGIWLSAHLAMFVMANRLGRVTGEAGMLRLTLGLVRIPDIAFVSRVRFPNGRIPHDAIPDLAPDLAVEVLSESNTRAEMARKRREYFAAGCRLVWEIDPVARTVVAFTGPDESAVVSGDLDGGTVVPGFRLPLADLFAVLDNDPVEPADG